MADDPGPDEPTPLEFDPAPTIAGRVARWSERARIIRTEVEEARAEHESVDLAFDLVERDSTIGGGMLGGALAYRLFVVLLPLSLFLVAGIGIYADTTGSSPSEVAARSGLTGLVASQVAVAASSSARWAIFIVTLPVLLYATAMLYRSIAIVHAIAWHSSGRAVKITAKGLAYFAAAMFAQFVSVGIVGWFRRNDAYGGIAALLLYGVLLGAAWLVLSQQLPRRDVDWRALLPGSALIGLGMLLVNSFNVYITSRLVEERADTYGALGIAAALLFSLYLVGRLIVASAVLNATLDTRHSGHE